MSTAVEDTFVGVRFREETNLTLCSTGGRIYARGEKVVVDLESGPAFGHVEQSPMPVFKPCQKSSARPILRPADADDLAAYDRQRQSEHERQALRPGAGARAQARHEDLPGRFLPERQESDFLLHLRRQGGLPATGARPLEPVLGAGEDGAGGRARRGRADRRHRHLRPDPLLLDLAQGLPADLHPDGEAAEPEPQPLEDLRPVRPAALLPGLRGRAVTRTRNPDSRSAAPATA